MKARAPDAKTKNRKEPADDRRRAPSAANLQKELDRRTRELAEARKQLAEALEQQTATSEVLRVISSSTGDLQSVFQPMLANAIKLCEASYGAMWLREGDAFRNAAFHGALPAEFIEIWRSATVPVDSAVLFGPLARSRKPAQVADIRETPAYLDGHQLPVTAGDVAGIRTMVGVPMLKNAELIGAIIIYRREVRPFTDKQIALVQNFAAQAVIAIENTRLLNELRQRTDDLSEALEQQTATSEVLSVISSSAGDLKPVFQTMLENATRICEAKFGILWLREGDGFRSVGLHNLPPAYAEQRQREPVIRPGPGTGLGRVAKTKQVTHVADVRAEAAYIERDPLRVSTVELGGYRTVLDVPMLKDDELIGVITIYRQEVRPFTDKQVALLANFASQAVIAIENTRLLNELRESLLAADRDLGGAAASSPARPASCSRCSTRCWQNSTRICEAKFGHLCLYERDAFRRVAHHGVPPALAELTTARSFPARCRGALDARAPDEAGCSFRRHVDRAATSKQSAWSRSPSSRCPDVSHRADAQGKRADRCDQYLPPGGPAVHRQADRTGPELRRPGRHRHREHPSAQRAAAAHRRPLRVAGAADRHR